MGAVTRLARDRFRVDFGALSRGGGLLSGLRGVFDRGPVRVDPLAVATALCEVLGHADERDVDKRLVAWNSFRVFLSREDFEALRPLRKRLLRGLDAALGDRLRELDADTEGRLVVQLLVDEESDLPEGVGEVHVAHAPEPPADAPEPSPDDPDGDVVTMRLRPRPKPLAPASTARVTDATTGSVAADALVLRWGDHRAQVPAGAKVLVGRPHANPPPGFVALVGATRRINSTQLAIENAPDQVVITRPASANPVAVGARRVPPGGKFAVQELPVDLNLSNGELVLRLSRGESP